MLLLTVIMMVTDLALLWVVVSLMSEVQKLHSQND